MRIAFISSARVPSDTANSIQVMKVCQSFAQLGHELTLLAPGPRPTEEQTAGLNQHYGLGTPFSVEWLPVHKRRVFPWKAARRARQMRVDLVYAWPLQAAALSLLAGLPTMLELHDFPSGHFGPLWLRFFVKYPGRKRLLPITAALRSALNLPLAYTVVAPDGVDLERYASLPDPATARRALGMVEAATVLCTGHLYEGRGADLFLRLAERFPGGQFVWVGGRPKDVETWAGRAAQAGLKNISFTGFVPNEHIPLYQSAADVLLMPYQQEVATSSGGNTAAICSPMKMFEYMAAGRAILSSDLPVLREVLDEHLAVFAPADDLEAWSTALRNLLSDDARRKTLAENARQAVKRYAWIERARRSLVDF